MAIQVATPADLQKVGSGVDGWNLDSDYIQTADIDMAGVSFTPIAFGEGEDFEGSYDGKGFRIRNLTISLPSEYGVGLFGNVKMNAEFTNIRLSNVSVTGDQTVGGLIGLVRSAYPITGSGRVYRCSVEEETNAVESYANCGLLIGQIYLGGDASETFTIEETAVKGEVITGGPGSGGAIGLISATWGPYLGKIYVLNCYSRADVTGGQHGEWWGGTGGLIGSCGDQVEVVNCYAAGGVTGTLDVGGLIGYAEPADPGGEWDAPVVENCYYDTELSGQTDDTGKGEPRSTAEMTYPENFTTTYIDWDFTNIWTHDPTYTINDGYPHFGVGGFNIWVYKNGLWNQVTALPPRKSGEWKDMVSASVRKSGDWESI